MQTDEIARSLTAGGLPIPFLPGDYSAHDDDALAVAADGILMKMEDLLRQRGWGQRQFSNGCGGALCLRGALVYVGAYPSLANLEVQRRLELKLGPSAAQMAWNDTPGRTADEVLALLQELRGSSTAEVAFELAREVAHVR